LADDRDLWNKISQGDADAFDAFCRENAPQLQAFSRQVVSPQAAEDVVQETLTQMLESAKRIRARAPDSSFLSLRDWAEWWRKQGPWDPGTENKDSLSPPESCHVAIRARFWENTYEKRVGNSSPPIQFCLSSHLVFSHLLHSTRRRRMKLSKQSETWSSVACKRKQPECAGDNLGG
jgi:hypothetical protein